MALTNIKYRYIPIVINWSNLLYPTRDTLEKDQSMVESGVTEGGKNTATFHFRGWTQQESSTQTWSLKLKCEDFQSYPWRETAASGGEKSTQYKESTL